MVFKRQNRRYKKKFRKKMISDKKKYGIVKSLNYGGFHTFKEKVITTLSLRTVLDGTTNLMTACYGTYSNPGLTYSLSGQNTQIDVAQYINYVSLFKFYKITGIKTTFYPFYTESDTENPLNSRQVMQLWYSTKNHKLDNENSFFDVMKSNPKIINFKRPISVYWKPRTYRTVVDDPSEDIEGQGQGQPVLNLNQQVNINTSRWISTDMNNDDVVYSGLQWGLLTPGTAAASNIPIQTAHTLYLQFKGNN